MVPTSFFNGLSVILVAVVHRHGERYPADPVALEAQLVGITEMCLYGVSLPVCSRSACFLLTATSLTLVKD